MRGVADQERKAVVTGSKPWPALFATGAGSVLCYGLLFAYESEVMATFTRTDAWYPALPVLTAFVFSLVHGAFTGYFWDVLGVKARGVAEARTDEADTD